jgi:hypothetical protein
MAFKTFLILLAVFACGLLWSESSIYLRSGNLETDVIANSFPSSIKVAKKRLDNCYEAIKSPQFMTSSTSQYNSTLKNCAEISRSVNQQFPTYSYGWFLSAMVASRASDTKNELVSLTNSYKTNKIEAWVARLRIEHLTEYNIDLLFGKNFRREIDRDIETLVRSNKYWDIVAYLYLQKQLRSRITDLVGTLPATDQKRFLSAMTKKLNREQ